MHDLTIRAAADDMFSSDLTREELLEKLGHLHCANTKVAFIFSGRDEYVPKKVDVQRLSNSIRDASNAFPTADGINKATTAGAAAASTLSDAACTVKHVVQCIHLPDADHAVSDELSSSALIDIIGSLLQRDTTASR